MAKKYDIVVTSTYESGGETKKRYTNIGAVFETDKGLSIKIESLPVGWNGWANCYEPKERDERRESPRQPQRSAAPAGGGGFEGMDDDIPFANPLRSRALCLAC